MGFIVDFNQPIILPPDDEDCYEWEITDHDIGSQQEWDDDGYPILPKTIFAYRRSQFDEYEKMSKKLPNLKAFL